MITFCMISDIRSIASLARSFQSATVMPAGGA